jgi:peroxiredoxin
MLQLYGEDAIVQAVKYVIADSPFSSFKRIATELVCKMVRLPEFIAGIVADAFANKIQELHGLNLKDLNLSDINSRVPVVFLYSNNDEIMGQQHMEDITSTFNGPK